MCLTLYVFLLIAMKVKENSEKARLKLNSQKNKIMASGPNTSWKIDGGTMETVTDFILGGSKITADGDCSHEIERGLLPWKKTYDQPRQHIKKQRHDITNKGPSSQSYGFSSSHVWMWELDHKESWAQKNWWFWTVVLEKTLESPLDCKEIQPVHPKGNQSWIFIQRTDAEAETPILWPHDVKNWLTGKIPDAGKDWRREQKGMTENEMVGWHHQLDGHEFEQAQGVGDEQGGLACCSPWGRKESDTTELNWTLGDSGCYNAPFRKGKLRLKTAYANYSMSQRFNKPISNLSLLSWKFMFCSVFYSLFYKLAC